MIKAVIFDFDGVIAQTETNKQDHMTAYFRSLGLEVDLKNLYRMAGGTYLDKEQMLDEIFGNQKKYWGLKAEILDHKTAQSPLMDIRTPGIIETLEKLKKQGIRIASGSNSRKERLISSLDACEVLSYFEHVESGYDLGKRKPDPYVYTFLIEELGLLPEQCIIVEDSALGIRAGKQAGARVIALRDRDGAIDQSEADAIIYNITEILQYI